MRASLAFPAREIRIHHFFHNFGNTNIDELTEISLRLNENKVLEFGLSFLYAMDFLLFYYAF